MGATLANQFALYKEHFVGNSAEIFFTSKKLTSPILASLDSKSMDDGGGRGYVQPVIHRLSGAVGSTFARAQNKARGATSGSTFGSDRWVVQPFKYHGVANFAHDNVLAAKGDSDKLMDVIKTGMEAGTLAIRKRMAHYVSGNGYGKVGVILAVGNAFVDIDPALCNRVQEDDPLCAASGEAAGALRNIAATDEELLITAINRKTGRLTLSADPTAGGDPWLVGDTLFRGGDRENDATPERLVISGLGAWFGEDADLHGVTARSSTLIAHQIDGSGKDHATASVEAQRTLFSYESYASVQYVSPVDFETVALDKDAAKTVQMEVGKYRIAFDGLMVSWYGQTIAMLPDALLDPSVSFVGPFDDEEVCPFLAHNDELVNVNAEDGMDIRAVDGADSFESRLYSRGNVICPGPGQFARITAFGG